MCIYREEDERGKQLAEVKEVTKALLYNNGFQE